ncbi:uncharacterized protein BKA78DRAFT_322164 [Phyllosticta capitalensis]|uniref:uncharacterized protein n=1 Tax=Phyllosticta capitalensis TaxID=121624 RepID=UPI00312D461D
MAHVRRWNICMLSPPSLSLSLSRSFNKRMAHRHQLGSTNMTTLQSRSLVKSSHARFCLSFVGFGQSSTRE